MLKVTISEAKEGMVLARSVLNPEKPEYTLLKAGYELEAESIKRLRMLRVPTLWVKYPSLDFLDALIDAELIHHQQELYTSLKQQFGEHQELALAKLKYHDYVTQIGNLFRRLLASKAASSSFITDLHSSAPDIFLHGTMVASLALLVGMRLENYLIRERSRLPAHLATDLTLLGVGCLLHDLGKLQIPEQLRHFRLTAREQGDPAWRAHTEAGFEMIKGGLDPTAGQIVLNHHQHFDGSGFPARKCPPGTSTPQLPLKGAEIHVFCRIATVVDRFDGFRYLPDGSRAPVVVALKRMRNPGYVPWFDPVVYDTFIKAVPPFAPGEQVTLNTGQKAVVVELNEEQPCKPIIRPIDPDLATDPDVSNTLDQPDINLALRGDLHIARVGDFDVTPFLH